MDIKRSWVGCDVNESWVRNASLHPRLAVVVALKAYKPVLR